MKHNILYISGWYPTRIKPTLGNFVFKHAECASENNNIRALHVCTDPQLKTGIDRVTNTLPFPSTVIYIPQIRIPLLGKIINQIKIIRLYISEYKKIAADGFAPDLVHANIAYPIGIVAWILKKKFNLDYVISEHWTGYHSYADPRPGLIQRMIVRKIANKAKFILPVSNDLGKSMKMHGITTPMRTIANVVNTDLYTPSTDHASNDTIRIIHISTLENIQKNIRLLLDAFAKSLAKQPNLELHIITDGDLTDFSDQISSLSIADKIINHGRKDAVGVAEILKTGDFFLLTSNFENLPCVLIESISCGVPVISTNVGGVSEIINKENGMMVPPNNLDELTAAMELMIVKYKNYDKPKMHQYAVEKYSYKAIGDELTAVYEQCITKKQMIG